MGTSTTTGDGGMTPEERGQSKHLVYQYLPSRYGMNPDDLRKADAIEVVLGQGAKPGGGGMLLGQKISERVAGDAHAPGGRSTSAAPAGTPTGPAPTTSPSRSCELREITDWEKPVYVKVGATRTYYDVKLAVAAGADVVVVDGMQGGTAATQEVFIEHVGIPTLAAVPQAAQALQELGVHRKVQLIVSGGIRTGADVAKAMALGADAVAIGTAALIALGDNHPRYAMEYAALGSAAGFYDDFQDGRDPAGITTQDPRAGRPARPGGGRPPRRELPAGADHGGADPRPGLRQGAPAPPGARGPRGADHRGRRHGPGAAGRHVVDPRERYVSSPLHRPARRRRQRRVAARTRSATARDRLCGGHAITVVTVGASSTGTMARSWRRWARHDSGRTAEARPSAISWNSCVWSRSLRARARPGRCRRGGASAAAAGRAVRRPRPSSGAVGR